MGVVQRTLFVISKERGELALSTIFLRDQPFAAEARVLVPEELVSVVGPDPPAPTASYSTLEDILRAVDEQRTDLVFLCCGYLLVHEGLLSRTELEELVAGLRSRGCRIVTSDPFLGLTPTITNADADIQWALTWKMGWVRELHGWLARKLDPRGRLFELPCIEGLAHLYPTLVPDVGAQDEVDRISFFNPNTIRSRREVPESAEEEPATWLFALSPFDYEVQKMMIGRSGICRIVAHLIGTTQKAGRRPVLVAPPDIIEIMEALPGERDLVPFCPYGELEEQVLAAEYAFYWSTFSFSMLARVANEKPVFAFDRGRLARTVRSLYAAGQAAHFGGWAPPRISAKRLPVPKELEFLAGKQELAMRVVRERWQASPTPAQVVERLLSTDPESSAVVAEDGPSEALD